MYDYSNYGSPSFDGYQPLPGTGTLGADSEAAVAQSMAEAGSDFFAASTDADGVELNTYSASLEQEYVTFINYLYEGSVGREPDPNESALWVAALLDGASFDEVSNQVATSSEATEYQARQWVDNTIQTTWGGLDSPLSELAASARDEIVAGMQLGKYQDFANVAEQIANIYLGEWGAQVPDPTAIVWTLQVLSGSFSMEEVRNVFHASVAGFGHRRWLATNYIRYEDVEGWIGVRSLPFIYPQGIELSLPLEPIYLQLRVEMTLQEPGDPFSFEMPPSDPYGVSALNFERDPSFIAYDASGAQVDSIYQVPAKVLKRFAAEAIMAEAHATDVTPLTTLISTAARSVASLFTGALEKVANLRISMDEDSFAGKSLDEVGKAVQGVQRLALEPESGGDMVVVIRGKRDTAGQLDLSQYEYKVTTTDDPWGRPQKTATVTFGAGIENVSLKSEITKKMKVLATLDAKALAWGLITPALFSPTTSALARRELNKFLTGMHDGSPTIFEENSPGSNELLRGRYFQELTASLTARFADKYGGAIPSDTKFKEGEWGGDFRPFNPKDFLVDIVDGVDLCDVVGTFTDRVEIKSSGGMLHFVARNVTSLQSFSGENLLQHHLVDNPPSGMFSDVTQIFKWSIPIPARYLGPI